MRSQVSDRIEDSLPRRPGKPAGLSAVNKLGLLHDCSRRGAQSSSVPRWYCSFVQRYRCGRYRFTGQYAPRLIREICQIDPLTFPIEEETWFNKYEARNFGFERLNADWILSFDADERIAPDQIISMRAALSEGGADGYFTRWTTYTLGVDVADYKLSVFRKGFRSSGLVHENVQQHMRRKGGHAVWTDLIHLRHFLILTGWLSREISTSSDCSAQSTSSRLGTATIGFWVTRCSAKANPKPQNIGCARLRLAARVCFRSNV